MKKKSVPLLVCLFLLIVLPVVNAQYAYKTNTDGSIYTYDTNLDGSANIVAYSGPPWAVSIPASINGRTVTALGQNLFWFQTNLIDVIIPPTVTIIGAYCFESCVNLTNATIPDGVTSIGMSAFFYCLSLDTVVIPDSVTNIGDSAFVGCASLTDIVLGKGISKLGVVFDDCNSLGSIAVPTNVVSLEYSFSGCGNLTNVLLSDNLLNIYQAFASCSNLGSIVIPSNVTNLGGYVFLDCTSLTNVTISNGVANIGEYAFKGCTILTSLTLPASLTNIESYAFEGSSLKSISILGNASIGEYAFSKNFNLSLSGLYISGGVVGEDACFNCLNLTSLTLGSNMLGFDFGAFEDAPIGSLILTATVTNVGDSAFDNCSLTNLVILSTNLTVGGYAFVANPLTSVCLPANVNIAGDQVFMQCASLTNVVIGTGVPYLTFGMFLDCPLLTNVLCLGNAPVVAGYYPSDGSVFYGDTNATIYYLPGTTGWGPTYGGVDSYPGAPTALWNPAIQTADGSFGVNNNGLFGFNITGTPNIPVMVMACTNLANPVWTPVQSLTLTNGQAYFSDPQSSNSPARYYGLGFP